MKITLYYPTPGLDTFRDVEFMPNVYGDSSISFRGIDAWDQPKQIRTTLPYIIDETDTWEAENRSRFERIREGN